MSPPKTFRVDARIRNNLLIKAREALGYYSAGSASKALGISYQPLVCYEALTYPPRSVKTGEWKQSAIAIATAYKTIPELLWPDEIDDVKCTRTSVEIDAPVAFLEAPKTPEEHLLESGRTETIRSALDLLGSREKQILISRFGLDGDEPVSSVEIGNAIGVNRSRAAQLEVRALNKLRGLIDANGDPKTNLTKLSEEDVRKAEIQSRKTAR